MSNNTAQSEGYLEFVVESQHYAIPISTVREINQIAEITPVPRAATHICGVMNLRGQVLPVLDLKVRLHGQVTFKTRSSCIVVIETAEGVVGLLVDSVCRVVNFTGIVRAPEACHLPDISLVVGVAQDGEHTVTLLSMQDCIRDVDCNQLKAVHELRQAANFCTTELPTRAQPILGETVVRTDAPTSTLDLRSAALRLMD